MKLISVIIPTYNRVHTLPRAVESVLNQSYSRIELIIVDDGSDDGTAQYVESLGDARVRYVINKQNLGPAEARNKGVNLSKGEWIAFLDSDDVWETDKLEKQMNYVQNAGGECKMVYCEYAIYQESEMLGIVPEKEMDIMEKSGQLLEQLLRGPLIGTVTMLVEREAFLETGGFNADLKALEDYEFSLRFARMYRIGFVEEVLVKAYNSAVSVNKQWSEQIHTYFYIVQEFLEDMKKYGILWRKLCLIEKEAEEYECRENFVQEMKRFTEQLTAEQDREKAFCILRDDEEAKKNIMLEEETEEFFAGLECKRELVLTERENIIHRVNDMLMQSDTQSIMELGLFFREGIGRQVYTHCSDIQKLYTINMIIRAEQEAGEGLFIEDTMNYNELMQKYRNLVYYLRRFELAASDEGCMEGVDFLLNSSVSVIAVYTILQKEIFANRVRLVCRCCDMLAGKREEMRIGLLLCMAEAEPATQILLKIAEWNLEKGNGIEALQYLEKIEEADEGIASLRRELADKLYG